MVIHYTETSLSHPLVYVGYCLCNGKPAMYPDECTDKWNGVDCKECLKRRG